jgi:hypothetical protein
MMADPARPGLEHRVPTSLIVRDSTARAPGLPPTRLADSFHASQPMSANVSDSP